MAYSDSTLTCNRIVNKIEKIIGKYDNLHLLQDVDNYLTLLEETNYNYIRNAYSLIEMYFEDMCNFIKRLER